VEPVPLLYLEVLAAGIVVGIVVDVLTGVPWWRLPLVALAATWLCFLSSAFHGPMQGGLARDLRIAVQPGRETALHEAENEKAFREAAFPLLGLDESWAGDRWLGGFTTANGEVSELDLGHSRVSADSGVVRLVVGVQVPRNTPRGRADEDVALTLAALSLDSRLVRAGGTGWQPGDDEAPWLRLAPASRLTISVDGAPVEFEGWGEGERWVAVARVVERIVTLTAHNMEPKLVSLRTITDLEPYVEGARLLRRRR